MKFSRVLFGALVGRRPPRLQGTVTVAGPSARITIRRDGFGVPHIEVSNAADAWFGLGFCVGQDRTFQLEGLLRAGRGTLAELVGRDGLDVDRFSRRVGYWRAAQRQLQVLDPDIRAAVAAYAAGVTAGGQRGVGRRRRPHEFTLLRARPTPWTDVDVVTAVVMLANLMGSPWDSELARLRIALADGPDAVRDLEPTYPASQPVAFPPASRAGPAADRLAAELRAFEKFAPSAGGSNNWAISAPRSATGRPLLANDTHLPTTLPSPWYLAHLTTPEWEVAGASFVGGPAFGAGHNGTCAWGTTLGYADNADLFIEEIGPDCSSVREGAEFVPCEVREEVIAVRRGKPVIERVLETPRGPIIGPAVGDDAVAISLKAVWLEPLPVRGMLDLPRVRSFEEFRAVFADWPAPSLNMAYADSSGTIAWQLVGLAPRRSEGSGAFPQAGWEAGTGWAAGLLDFDDLPYVANPPEGFVGSSNAKPVADDGHAYLGCEWLDGYRMSRVFEALAARSDWDRAAMAKLQLDHVSIPWRELRDVVLAAPPIDDDGRLALDLLREWDGDVGPESAAASVYELALEHLVRRVAEVKAPNSARWARGRGSDPLRAASNLVLRRHSHVVRLLREQPPEWMTRPWAEEIALALSSAVALLREKFGAGPAGWAWGRVRPLTLVHPVGTRGPLASIFNIGPLPGWGDATTLSQASIDPFNPLANLLYIAVLRMTIDVGNWEDSRFAICGGQSGNPVSPHYEDQVPYWQNGAGIPIAWSREAVERAAVETLLIEPALPGR